MAHLPGAVDAPSSKAVVGNLPWQEVVRKQVPSTSASEHLEDGVESLVFDELVNDRRAWLRERVGTQTPIPRRRGGRVGSSSRH